MKLTTKQIHQLDFICEWIKENDEWITVTFDDPRTDCVVQSAEHFQWLIKTQED